MDQLLELLKALHQQGTATGRFRGLLHLLVGRRITRADGADVSSGMTWREAAALLKKARWNREAVHELGLDLASLPPRDREKFWYAAISRAGLGTRAALADAEALMEPLRALGYAVGPGPGPEG